MIKARSDITLTAVVDVVGTTRYYLLATAAPAKPTANPPAADWTATEPAYTAGSLSVLYITDLTLYSDGTWSYSDVSVSSSYEAARQAYNKANTAQISSDGKNSIYYGTTAPTSGSYKNNDVWYDASANNAMHLWNGSTWALQKLGSEAIGSLKAENIDVGAVTADKIAVGAVTSTKIDSGAITTDKIAAGAVETDKLSVTAKDAVDLVNMCMRFDSSGLAIYGKETSGSLDNICNTLITDQDIQFRLGTNKVSWMSSSKFYISNGEIKDTLQIGNFILDNEDGALNIKYGKEA